MPARRFTDPVLTSLAAIAAHAAAAGAASRGDYADAATRSPRCAGAPIAAACSKNPDVRRHHLARVAGLRVKRTQLATTTHARPMIGATNRE
jgi:hypothetical protein